MNKNRRKELNDIFRRIEKEIQPATDAFPDVEEIKAQLEDIRDAEQEAYDNLPESLQDGERGEQMTEAVENIETAISNLEEIGEAFSELKDKVKEALEAIDNASAEQS